LFFHCYAGEEGVGAELAIWLAYFNKVRSEMSYSVVAGNEDDITARFLDQTCAIIKWQHITKLVLCTEDICTAIKPRDDGQFL